MLMHGQIPERGSGSASGGKPHLITTSKRLEVEEDELELIPRDLVWIPCMHMRPAEDKVYALSILARVIIS